MGQKRSRRVWTCIASLAVGLAMSAAACAGPEPKEAGPVTLEVRLEQGGMARRREASLASFDQGAAMATAFDEVTRVQIDVFLADSGLPYYTNFELTEVTPNTWQGQIPILPRNTSLRFAGRALGPADEIAFAGETIATLTVNNQNVEVPLAPAQDNQTYPIPRMFRIVYPEEIFAGQEEQVTFTIQGNPGVPIHLAITAAGSTTPSPAFAPATGTITLTNTVANFMTVYTAPDVSEDTNVEYQVTITAANAAAAVAVTTNFTAQIRRRPPGAVVTGTRPTVRFNPMVETLTANGSTSPTSVSLLAAVSDDSAPAALTYQWSYAPALGTPAATFANATTNPATLQDYTLAHQGTITLAVTDEDGGTTTLRYTIVPDQFADAIDHGATNGLRRIAAGRAHTCVLTGARNVRCWGDNTYGQLGYSNTLDIGDAPTRLPYTAGDVPLGATSVVQLVAGDDHTCALLDSGLITCWGNNQYGQLGYGRTDNLGDGEPVTSFGYVTLGGLATRIAAGANHTCAVLTSGTVRCWGKNTYGQLGHGNTTSIGDNEPVYTVGDLDLGTTLAKDLALGAEHTCVLSTTGAVRCWGYNAYGQLGYGHTNSLADNEPLTAASNVSLTGPIRRLAAGAYHTCAITVTGALRCWGQALYGQLGHSLAYTVNNHSWGDNPGELPSAFPSDINVGGLATDVAAGMYHSCALTSESKLKCWGSPTSYQLGYGINGTVLSVPSTNGVDLDGVTPFQVTAGQLHTCTLRANGTARCWGSGDSGRLGRGSLTTIGTPAGSPDIQIFAP